MLEPTDDGASKTSISRMCFEGVWPKRLQADAWQEYFTGEIHCNQAIQSLMYGKGTKPPDKARERVIFPDPTRKAGSCENAMKEVSCRRVITTPGNETR